MMIRLLADENFNGAAVRGLLRRVPSVDIVRVQDVGLSGSEDPVILDWAAREGRVLLTHDIRTVPLFAYQRVEAGQPMPGVIVTRESLPVGRVIDDLLFILECSESGEWEGQLRYLPS
jgi:predicted nuclease of predicted toxin-antitoxin system